MPIASHTPDPSRAVGRDRFVVDARVVTSSNHNASTQSYLCFDWMRRLEWVIVTGHHSSRGPPIDASGASGRTNVSNASSRAETRGFPGTTNARVVEDAEEEEDDDAFSLARARRIEGMDGRTNERRAVERRDATRRVRVVVVQEEATAPVFYALPLFQGLSTGRRMAMRTMRRMTLMQHAHLRVLFWCSRALRNSTWPCCT